VFLSPRSCLAVAVSLLASCTAVIDLGHLTGAESRTDEVMPEAGGDASSQLDTGGMTVDEIEGGVDAGVDGSTSLCSGAGLLFCDDFEGRTATLGPWNSVDGSGPGGTLVLAKRSSDPSSVLLGTTAGGTQSLEVLLRKNLQYAMVLGNKVTLEFDFQFVADRAGFGSNQSADHVNPFFFETSKTDYYGFIEVARNECAFIVNDAHYDAPSLCAGSKVHVSYEVTFGSTNGRVRIAVGGVSVADATSVTVAAPSTFTFGFGLGLKGTYPTMAVAVDNVTVR
jgi:hypothetical protein